MDEGERSPAKKKKKSSSSRRKALEDQRGDAAAQSSRSLVSDKSGTSSKRKKKKKKTRSGSSSDLGSETSDSHSKNKPKKKRKPPPPTASSSAASATEDVSESTDSSMPKTKTKKKKKKKPLSLEEDIDAMIAQKLQKKKKKAAIAASKESNHQKSASSLASDSEKPSEKQRERERGKSEEKKLKKSPSSKTKSPSSAKKKKKKVVATATTPPMIPISPLPRDALGRASAEPSAADTTHHHNPWATAQASHRASQQQEAMMMPIQPRRVPAVAQRAQAEFGSFRVEDNIEEEEESLPPRFDDEFSVPSTVHVNHNSQDTVGELEGLVTAEVVQVPNSPNSRRRWSAARRGIPTVEAEPMPESKPRRGWCILGAIICCLLLVVVVVVILLVLRDDISGGGGASSSALQQDDTPTVAPTTRPTVSPTTTPTVAPTVSPTTAPTQTPGLRPTVQPTFPEDTTGTPFSYGPATPVAPFFYDGGTVGSRPGATTDALVEDLNQFDRVSFHLVQWGLWAVECQDYVNEFVSPSVTLTCGDPQNDDGRYFIDLLYMDLLGCSRDGTTNSLTCFPFDPKFYLEPYSFEYSGIAGVLCGIQGDQQQGPEEAMTFSAVANEIRPTNCAEAATSGLAIAHYCSATNAFVEAEDIELRLSGEADCDSETVVLLDNIFRTTNVEACAGVGACPTPENLCELVVPAVTVSQTVQERDCFLYKEGGGGTGEFLYNDLSMENAAFAQFAVEEFSGDVHGILSRRRR